MKKSIITFLALTLFLLLGATHICQAQMLDMDNTRINTDDGNAPQYDEAIAINHQNPDNAVIIWQDMGLVYPRVSVGYTFNGGQSWNEAILHLPGYAMLENPSVGADTNGNFFACMYANDTIPGHPGAIIIIQSADGGITWSEPRIAVTGTSQIFNVMPDMVVDNTSYSSSGFIYIAWVREGVGILPLVFSTQSSDMGHTFLDPVQVSDSTGIVQWPNINIRSAFGNADVDVAWYRQHYPGILFDHSVTEGWTFGRDYWPMVTGAFNDTINGGIEVSTTPVMAADNQNGSGGFEKSYLVYMDSSNSNWDVYCVGITSFLDNTEYIDFSTPVRVNDDPPNNGADHFMPAVAVDETGAIHVAFFDRRNDPNNLLYDVYYSSSSDFGETWTPNVRVSNISSDPSLPSVAGAIGNRIGIAAWGGQVVITWTDCRNGNTDVYVSRMIEIGIKEEPAPLPNDITLDNLYPNPFNSSVEIKYTSISAQQVSVEVVDLLGRHVADLFNGACRAGSNSLIWDGKNSNGHIAGSGVYFVRLNADNRTLLKKAVLLK